MTSINVDVVVSGPHAARRNPHINVRIISTAGVLLDCQIQTTSAIALYALRKALSDCARRRLDTIIRRQFSDAQYVDDMRSWATKERFGARVGRAWAYRQLPRWVREAGRQRYRHDHAALIAQQQLQLVHALAARASAVRREADELNERIERLREERLAPAQELAFADGGIPWAVLPKRPTALGRCIEAISAFGLAGAIVAALGAASWVAGAVLALVQ